MSDKNHISRRDFLSAVTASFALAAMGKGQTTQYGQRPTGGSRGIPATGGPSDIHFKEKVEPILRDWAPIDITDRILEKAPNDINFYASVYIGAQPFNTVVSHNERFFVTDGLRLEGGLNYDLSDALQKVCPEELDSSLDAKCLFDFENKKVYLLPNYSALLKEKGLGDEFEAEVFSVGDDGTVVYGIHKSTKKKAVPVSERLPTMEDFEEKEVEKEYVAGVFARFKNSKEEKKDRKNQIFINGDKKDDSENGDKKYDFEKFRGSRDGKIGRVVSGNKVTFYDMDTLQYKTNGHGEIEAMSRDGKVIFRHDYINASNQPISTYIRFNEDDRHPTRRYNPLSIMSEGGITNPETSALFKEKGNADRHDYIISDSGTAYAAISKEKDGTLRFKVFRWEESGGIFKWSTQAYPEDLTEKDIGSIRVQDNGRITIGKSFDFEHVGPDQYILPFPR